MKVKLLSIVLCLVMFSVGTASAATMAGNCLVNLSFDDVVVTLPNGNDNQTTANAGTLGGVANVNYGDTGIAAPTSGVDSVQSWDQQSLYSNAYSSYTTPALSSATVAFWVRPNSITGSNQEIISIDSVQGAPAGTPAMRLSVGPSLVQGSLMLTLNNGIQAQYCYIDTTGAGQPMFAAATWTHIALTYDSVTAAVKVYLNGDGSVWGGVGNPGMYEAAGHGQTPGTSIVAGDPSGSMLVQGPYSLGGMQGMIDNVFLFDAILTGTEIGNLMNYNNIVPEPVTALMLLLGIPALLLRKKR